MRLDAVSDLWIVDFPQLIEKNSDIFLLCRFSGRLLLKQFLIVVLGKLLENSLFN